MPKDNQEIEDLVAEFYSVFEGNKFEASYKRLKDVDGKTTGYFIEDWLREKFTMYGNVRELAPKDNQEIERIVEEIFDTEYIGGNQPNLNKDYIRQALTTYGNARELEGVEKVEEGVPAEREKNYDGYSLEYRQGFDACRKEILDHIAKLK